MEIIEDAWNMSGHLHHAYFLVGEKEVISTKLIAFLEGSLGIVRTGNPDFWHGTFNTFTIDHARSLSDSQGRKVFKDKNIAGRYARKIFIIETNIITEEAQNALLKVFEEPTAGTHFFIISPQDILLPTLRSRMQVVQSENLKIEQYGSEDILQMPLRDRLRLVKEITESISDEEKTKQDAIALLNAIELELYGKGVEQSAEALTITESARASLYDRGAPVKIILEQVIFTI